MQERGIRMGQTDKIGEKMISQMRENFLTYFILSLHLFSPPFSRISIKVVNTCTFIFFERMNEHEHVDLFLTQISFFSFFWQTITSLQI